MGKIHTVCEWSVAIEKLMLADGMLWPLIHTKYFANHFVHNFGRFWLIKTIHNHSAMIHIPLCRCLPKSSSDWMRKYCFLRVYASQWRHNERDSFSNHQPRDCLLNALRHWPFVRGFHRWPGFGSVQTLGWRYTYVKASQINGNSTVE